MKPRSNALTRRAAGFTLVEILLVVGLISIIGSMAISNFSNASQDTRRVVSRQQQAALQNAVNSWVAKQISGNQSVSQAQGLYNNFPNGTPRKSKDKLNLVQNYLDDTTYAHFIEYTSTDDQVRSAAMERLNFHLSLPDWANNSYPKVNLIKP